MTEVNDERQLKELIRQTDLLESIRTAAWWCAIPVIICACVIGFGVVFGVLALGAGR